MYNELVIVVNRYLGMVLIGYLVSGVAGILSCSGDYLSVSLVNFSSLSDASKLV